MDTCKTDDKLTKDIETFVNKHSKLLESSLSANFIKAITELDTEDKELNEIEDALVSYVNSMQELSNQMKKYKAARKKFEKRRME